jgi:D-galactarolactone cycloisomerase
LQPDTCSAGGLSECKKIADMAAAYVIRYAPHVWGSGIATAAALQLLAVLPSFTPPSLYRLEPMLKFDCTASSTRSTAVDAHQAAEWYHRDSDRPRPRHRSRSKGHRALPHRRLI